MMDLVCKVCNLTFTRQSNLSRHARVHKELKIKCDCGLAFLRSDNLKRHQLKNCTAFEEESKLVVSNEPITIPKSIKNSTDDSISQSSGGNSVQSDSSEDSEPPPRLKRKHAPRKVKRRVNFAIRNKHHKMSLPNFQNTPQQPSLQARPIALSRFWAAHVPNQSTYRNRLDHHRYLSGNNEGL